MLRDERETIIHIHDGEGTVAVYSWRKTIWARCERAGLKKTLEDGGGREYVGEARRFRFRFLGAEKRTATPAQIENLRKAREKKPG